MKKISRPTQQTGPGVQAPGSGTSRRVFIGSAAAACGAFVAGLAPAHAWAAGLFGGKEDASVSVTILEFGPDGKQIGKSAVPRVTKPDKEWKAELSPISFEVARKEGTERPYSGDSWNEHGKGLYRCVCCGTALFSSETKFESGTGWPSFWQPIARENVLERTDSSPGHDEDVGVLPQVRGASGACLRRRA